MIILHCRALYFVTIHFQQMLPDNHCFFTVGLRVTCDCGVVFSLQIRVVNAFQEPASTPAQLPYKGRPSFASLVSVAAKAAAAESAAASASAPNPAAASKADNNKAPKVVPGKTGETCVWNPEISKLAVLLQLF